MGGGLGDTLAELAGDVGTPLDMGPGAQHVLQDTECHGLGGASCGSLADHRCVYQATGSLLPHLTCNTGNDGITVTQSQCM